MDKIPARNSIVKFWGYKTPTDVLKTEFTGKVVGYGTVDADIWENEPEAVCLVLTDDSTAVMGVSHKGMELVSLPPEKVKETDLI